MNISAKVICDSITPEFVRLLTYEVVLPKVLLSEANTHRQLSRNYSSSRAIPVLTNSDVDSFEPLYWGLNQPGMIAKKEELSPENIKIASSIWEETIEFCKNSANRLASIGLHKQWANRPNDWHTMSRGVISMTEDNNFFLLRNHSAAQPEMEELAKQMLIAKNQSTPNLLQYGDWHLPYISTATDELGKKVYYTQHGSSTTVLSVENAKKISASCCAQASYRKLDDSLEKANRVFSMLNLDSKSEPAHFSPVEHQAVCIKYDSSMWQDGVTHIDRHENWWSGNFREIVQWRQLIMQGK